MQILHHLPQSFYLLIILSQLMNSSILIASILMAILSFSILQNSYATGGTEVIETVIPQIQVVIDAVNNNDKEKALTELEDIRIQLQDTFFVDDAEEELEQEKEN